MSEKSLVLILLGSVLANNYALQSFLGIDAVLGESKGAVKSAVMGLAVTVLTVLSALITWPLYHLVLLPLGMDFLKVLTFVMVIAGLAYLLELLVKKLLRKSLGISLPLLICNSLVLGVVVENILEGLSFGQAMIHSLGGGLGFLLAMVVFAGVSEKIDSHYVPKAFRGLPVSLVAAGIISLALFAF